MPKTMAYGYKAATEFTLRKRPLAGWSADVVCPVDDAVFTRRLTTIHDGAGKKFPGVVCPGCHTVLTFRDRFGNSIATPRPMSEPED